jgi:hypothetical protein
MKRWILLGFLLMTFLALSAIPLLQLVDTPTAAILEQGDYQLFAKIYRHDGFIGGASVGLIPHFMFGFSFGGEDVVGNQEVIWHPGAAFEAKYQVLQSQNTRPALSLGFSSQGHGAYHKNWERYDLKSKGFYLVADKENVFSPHLTAHAGVNRSMEVEDGDKDVNAFLGADYMLNDAVRFVADYDFAFNDNGSKTDNAGAAVNGAGKGYLNMGALLNLTTKVQLKVFLYDLLNNSPNLDGSTHKMGWDRSVMLQYATHF